MMTLRKHARTLLTASLLALAVAGILAPQSPVHAQPKDGSGGNDVTCSFQNPRNGDWEFFLPGDSITLTDGLGYSYKLTCGPDGHWTIEAAGATTTQPATRPVMAPLPASISGGA